MTETLTFHFEGALADDHRMNFYESARFQYSAARLIVKLDQFRRTGRFSQKITNNSNLDIQLVTQSEGSFNIQIEDEGPGASDKPFINVALGDLVAYVSERVIEKIDETTLKGFRYKSPTSAPASSDGQNSELDQLVLSSFKDATFTSSLPDRVKELVRRRVAETFREQRMETSRAAISKIDFARSQRLTAMSAPLISDMATALRRSANTLEVSSSTSGDSSPLLFLNRQMAREIETASVDDDITPILGDVIQFNKDNGWGKIRIEGSLVVNFSIPYDILPRMKDELIETMKRDQVYIQAYFVRDRADKVIRIIAVGILPTPIS